MKRIHPQAQGRAYGCEENEPHYNRAGGNADAQIDETVGPQLQGSPAGDESTVVQGHGRDGVGGAAELPAELRTELGRVALHMQGRVGIDHHIVHHRVVNPYALGRQRATADDPRTWAITMPPLLWVAAASSAA